jgi:cytochrome c oxidase subunit 2
MPGRTITGWFRPNRIGTYDIQCTQMCGIGHALMAGRIIVETPQDHAAWLLRNSSPSVAEKAGQQAPPATANDVEATMAEVRR